MLTDLVNGESGTGVFLCRRKDLKETAGGKPYFDLDVCDNSGMMNCKVWDVSRVQGEFGVGDAITVSFCVTEYDSRLQMKADLVQKAKEGTYHIESLCPTTQYDVDKLYTKVLDFVQMVKNEHLFKLLNYFFSDEDFVHRYIRSSAAVGIHHAFIGGLLQHSYMVTRLAYTAGQQYPFVNVELLITASLLHDIGKLHEISLFPANKFTNNGHYLGHVVEGQNMIRDACHEIAGFPPELCEKVCHCILAHHGELELGSPIKPVLVEALILSMCDNLDTRVEHFYEVISDKGKMSADGWSSKDFVLGTRLAETAI